VRPIRLEDLSGGFEDLSGHHLLDRHDTSDPRPGVGWTDRDVYVEQNRRIEKIRLHLVRRAATEFGYVA
jgi:hypothetical protein